MYLGRTLAVVGIIYIGAHVISGAITCANEFCPGDNEKDWVYEYEADDGKKFIVIDGITIPKEQWQEKLGSGPYDKDTR